MKGELSMEENSTKEIGIQYTTVQLTHAEWKLIQAIRAFTKEYNGQMLVNALNKYAVKN